MQNRSRSRIKIVELCLSEIRNFKAEKKILFVKIAVFLCKGTAIPITAKNVFGANIWILIRGIERKIARE